ncbi:MAG: hypothetical protein RR626_09595 [Anaerovoracaceae bacterium]
MLFPIIKIKDGDSEPRIVGTNTHDCLYVDEKTRGIHYLNRQCFGSTEYEEEGIEFVPEPQGLNYDFPEIEMVDFEQLTEIYLENADDEIKEIMKKALVDIRKIEDKNIEYFEKQAEGMVISGIMLDFKSRKKLDERIRLIKILNKFCEEGTKK